MSSDSEHGDDESRKAAKKEKTSRSKSLRDRFSSLTGKLERLKSRDEPEEKPEGPKATVAVDVRQVKPRAEPRVLHGYTLTKEITFRDVCYAIRDGAFVNSDLPVIVSLEVHASPEQQETMVEIMTEAWKGLLIDLTPEMIADLEQGKVKKLPSPGELKNKILIKVKWAPPPKASGAAMSPGQETVDIIGQVANEKGAPEQKKASKVVHALSRLGYYTQGHSFRNFTQPGKSCLPLDDDNSLDTYQIQP